MLLRLLLLTIVIFINPSAEECMKSCTSKSCTFQCINVNNENLVYNLFERNNNHHNFCFIEIYNSYFPQIYSLTFLSYSFCNNVNYFSLRNSSLEFIHDDVFKDFSRLRKLDISNNLLRNLSFIGGIPESLNALILSGNHFESISDVFTKFKYLHYVDLSNCKINTIHPHNFLNIHSQLDLNLRNNSLSLFDVLFKDELRLSLDLSFNKIKSLDFKSRRIRFVNLNASHNQIEKMSEISCHDCGYNYYRTGVVVDLSFNNLNKVKLIQSFNGISLKKLILSNSNLDENFDFEIANFVTDLLDLTNNKIKVIPQNMCETDKNILDLSKTSMEDIADDVFSNCKLHTLNLSSNLLKVIKKSVFKFSALSVLDLSNCLIEEIDENAFKNLTLYSLLNLSNNKFRNIYKNTFANLERVETIDLSFNFLQHLENNLFKNCKNLINLNLSNSNLEIIDPKTFSGEMCLSNLNLQNNRLEKINFETLRVFGNLNLQNNSFRNLNFSFLENSSARFVNLSLNNIGQLTENFASFYSNIEEIDLSNSSICEIDSMAFKGLSNLQRLNLSNNCLETIVSDTFFFLRKLKYLDLSDNEISNFSKNAFHFGNILEELKISFLDVAIPSKTFITLNNVRVLNISNSINISFGANSLTGLINLQEFNVSYSEITDIIPGAFKGLNSLEEADFKILFRNINVIKEGTFEGLFPLTILDLSCLNISKLEVKAFLGLTNLEKLFLNNNKITKLVNGTFFGLENLKHLNLSQNQISVLESQSFIGLEKLEFISLSFNNLTKLYLGTFQNFPNLRTLNLHKNKINKLLTGTFSNLKKLEELTLSYNNITKLKMQNLMPLSSLKYLELTGNHLIQMSHLDLIKSLRQLEFVGINDNKWKCDNLATMLIAFQNYSIDWVSTESMTFTHENIDGINCYDICKFFYCVDEADVLFGTK